MEKSDCKSRIFWLDVARVIAIISISFNHSVNRSYATYDNQLNEFLSIPMWSSVFKTVVYIFSIIGVPLFLMISGSLLLKKNITNSSDIKYFYKNNLLKLFITTEIWYFIFYIFFTIRGTLSGQQSVPFFFKELISTLCFVNQTTINSMWYMPMILCVYMIIPFLCILKDKVSYKNTILPISILYFISFIIPSYNDFASLTGNKFAYIEPEALICSKFILYVILGYWISNGGLKKLNKFILLLGFVISFAICCIFQIYSYSKEPDIHLYYEFFLIPVCAGLLFEIVRRYSFVLTALSQPIEYISKISFGIYFVHIAIITIIMKFEFIKESLPQPLYCLFLEITSVLISILIITIISKIPLAKKYLFMIKD